MGNERSIYLDINIYRRITRTLAHWEKFEKFVDREEPGLLDNSTVLFTWSQVLEASDLGKITSKLEKTQVWKQEIEGKKLIDRLGFQKGLDKYFEKALKAIEGLPELQKAALLKNIDKAISHTCQEAQKLVQNTLLRYRDLVASDEYMENLSRELAWAFLTSYSFIQSETQWGKRKICYESLMALWHTLFLEDHNLVFFRMSERHYYSYLLYSPDVDIEKVKTLYPNVVTREDLANEIFKFLPLKPGSDLCDGEIIHYGFLGNEKNPVIGITMDGEPKIQQRMMVLDRCLTDLKQCVKGWRAEVYLGKIFTLNVNNEGDILHSCQHLPRVSCPNSEEGQIKSTQLK